MKQWNVNVYSGHLGIVDGEGNSVANVIGGRGNEETHRIANLIVNAVNFYCKYEEKQPMAILKPCKAKNQCPQCDKIEKCLRPHMQHSDDLCESCQESQDKVRNHFR